VHWLAFDEQSAAETLALKKSTAMVSHIFTVRFFMLIR
jgi:hypothetical protein